MKCPLCGEVAVVRRGYFRTHGPGRSPCNNSGEPTPRQKEIIARRNPLVARPRLDQAILRDRSRTPRDQWGRRVL